MDFQYGRPMRLPLGTSLGESVISLSRFIRLMLAVLAHLDDSILSSTDILLVFGTLFIFCQ
jgi:hypothetical protein